MNAVNARVNGVVRRNRSGDRFKVCSREAGLSENGRRIVSESRNGLAFLHINKDRSVCLLAFVNRKGIAVDRVSSILARNRLGRRASTHIDWRERSLLPLIVISAGVNGAGEGSLSVCIHESKVEISCRLRENGKFQRFLSLAVDCHHGFSVVGNHTAGDRKVVFVSVKGVKRDTEAVSIGRGKIGGGGFSVDLIGHFEVAAFRGINSAATQRIQNGFLALFGNDGNGFMRYVVKAPILMRIAVTIRANAQSRIQRIGIGLLESEVGAGTVQNLNAAYNMLHFGRCDLRKIEIPSCGRFTPANHLRMRKNTDGLGRILEGVNKIGEVLCENVSVRIQNEYLTGFAHGNIQAVFFKINDLALRAGEDYSWHRSCGFLRSEATEKMLVVDGFRMVGHNREIQASVCLDRLEIILGKFRGSFGQALGIVDHRGMCVHITEKMERCLLGGRFFHWMCINGAYEAFILIGASDAALSRLFHGNQHPVCKCKASFTLKAAKRERIIGSSKGDILLGE